jgi:hypothetical protein
MAVVFPQIKVLLNLIRFLFRLILNFKVGGDALHLLRKEHTVALTSKDLAHYLFPESEVFMRQI